MATIAGYALAGVAAFGACVLLKDTVAGKSIAKDLSRAEGNLKSAAGEVEGVARGTLDVAKNAVSDLIALRMTNTTIAILSGVAAVAAWKLLCPKRSDKDE